ncbi:MAG TPA: hypothetical protein VHB50_09775 [Bryobacteraceae bacterium]|nr:hypothetical protein [Bryobacteraceae bacterium]
MILRKSVRLASLLELVFVVGGAGVAQTRLPASTVPGTPPTTYKGISYVHGQLNINSANTNLAEILTAVARLTGADLDIPPAASNERIPAIHLGPGPARRIVESLLDDSDFDFLIQSSESDPDTISNVLLTVRDKTPAGTTPRQRLAQFTPPPPEPASPVPTTEAAMLQAEASSTPEPAPAEAPPPPSNPRVAAAAQADPQRIGALAPPASLDSQSISQQLQQMYQQRMQMTQQDRQAASPGHP